MSKNVSNYFFLIYFDKPKEKEENDEVCFKENTECIFTKKIKLNEENEKIIKIFKYAGEIKEEAQLDFSYDNKNYQLTLKNKNGNKFIFDILLKKHGKNNRDSNIEQDLIEIHDKMNYFIEALKKIKEEDKLEILVSEVIKL